MVLYKKMATLLNIETSTNVCSACLSKDGQIILNKENYEGQSHAVLLGQYVKELVEYAHSNNIKIDGVAISCGPGSYTGLRIGVSTAKGLCYGMDLPLIAVSTLKTMSSQALRLNKIEDDAWLCPMIDARRMEVYTTFMDKSLNEQKAISADIIDENSYADILAKHKVYMFGNGSDKCKDTLKHSNLTYLENICPLAKDMISLSEKAYAEKKFEDVAYFEPFYLKEFVATHSEKKLF